MGMSFIVLFFFHYSFLLLLDTLFFYYHYYLLCIPLLPVISFWSHRFGCFGIFLTSSPGLISHYIDHHLPSSSSSSHIYYLAHKGLFERFFVCFKTTGTASGVCFYFIHGTLHFNIPFSYLMGFLVKLFGSCNWLVFNGFFCLFSLKFWVSVFMLGLLFIFADYHNPFSIGALHVCWQTTYHHQLQNSDLLQHSSKLFLLLFPYFLFYSLNSVSTVFWGRGLLAFAY